jgi:Uma2 family endonuclease
VLIRRPDVSFIAADRLSGVKKEGHVTIAPDIAVEVISPNDKIYDLDDKIVDYKMAGVKVIWVVDPKARTVVVRRPGQATVELEEQDTLTGDPVLPGFSVLVRDLFPLDEPA